ncbi:MAG: hypothetical protein ACPGO3_00730 [Magnetospiraceae bacterium]
MTIIWGEEDRLRAACQTALPDRYHAALIANIANVLGNDAIELALTREGWYRSGGIVTADGTRIAENLGDWVEAESGGDALDFAAQYGDSGYIATRIAGATHYFIVPLGDKPLTFLQVEVEETREIQDRLLLDPENLPDDIDDIVDPLESVRLDPEPLSAPRYHLRRAINFTNALSDPESPFQGDKWFRRFIADWTESSAAETLLCDHWILTVVPYLDRFGEQRFDVKPRPRPVDELPEVPEGSLTRGADLARIIHAHDRAAGYPMAWFFSLVTGNARYHRVAEAAHEDLMGAYAYLPTRDVKILKRWIKDPYAL